MTTLSLVAILHTSVVATSADTYVEAHKTTTKTGKPMVILVGADWCPACQVMKESVIPQVKRRGLLRKVAFAIVNVDRQRDLGRQLTGGGPIPQLIMYRKTSNGWNRKKLIGGQSVSAVESFVNEGVQADKSERQAMSGKKATSPPDKQAAAGLSASKKVS